MSPDSPILRQSVRWGENYVSSALNVKLAGIIPVGVYHGFVVKPAGAMAVSIEHDSNYPRSVAVVERDGFSITVTMDDPGTVKIPASGKWFICIEAYYSLAKQGYQRVVARQEVAEHHVVLASVLVSDGETVITDSMIDEAPRNECFPAAQIIEDFKVKLADAQHVVVNFSDLLTKEALKRIALENLLRTESEQSAERLEQQENAANLQATQNALLFIQLSDRVTRESLTRISQNNDVITETALGRDRDAMRDRREAANAGIAINAMNRIMNLELAFYSGMSFSALPALVDSMGMSPDGYEVYGGATVAPISIVRPGETAPLGAAIVLKLERA